MNRLTQAADALDKAAELFAKGNGSFVARESRDAYVDASEWLLDAVELLREEVEELEEDLSDMEIIAKDSILKENYLGTMIEAYLEEAESWKGWSKAKDNLKKKYQDFLDN